MKYPFALAVATAFHLAPATSSLAADGHAQDAHQEDSHAAPDAHAAHDGHAAPAPAKTKTAAKKPAAAAAPAEEDAQHGSGGHGDHGAADQDQTADAHGGAPAKDAHASGSSKDGHSGAKVHIVLKDAVERLKDGNRRYAEGRVTNPRRGRDQRSMVAKAQLPFAVIVGCADSRVPPEILFDQGLGDLFVVRVAGNVVDDNALGSIEYAVEHLGAHLIVVLGHERCGAVSAACQGGEAGGHVGSLLHEIKPAVEVAHRYVKGQAQMLLPTAVRANVERVVDQLKSSWPVLGPEVREGKVTVMGAIYDLDDGLVEFLP